MLMDRDPLLREIAKLRERLTHVQEENRQLKDAFAPKVGFPKAWRLDPRESAILSALHANRGSYVTGEALLLCIAGFDEDQDDASVRLWLGKLRKKVQPLGIDIKTRHDEGYLLTPESRSVVARALGEHIPEAAAAEVQPAHPRGWTEEESAIVRAGYERSKTLALIRIELKAAGHRVRSLGSISAQAQKLGLTSVRSSPLWTREEDDIVREAYQAGLLFTKIRLKLAEAGFTRNRGAIGMRVISLGLSGDRVKVWTQPERAIVRAGVDMGLTYEDIRDCLRAAGYERGRTAVLKLAREMGCRRADAPWTEQDLDILRQRYAEKVPQREIAAELGRQVGGIAAKASKLGLLQRHRWTEEERARLVRGFENGEPLADVCRDIHRPYSNVYQEARRLGLKFAQAQPVTVERAA
jgi:transposase-like protein